MKLEMSNYRCTKEEFDSMSALQKRDYILQIDQVETNSWLRLMAKIYVIGFFVGVLGLIIILANIK